MKIEKTALGVPTHKLSAKYKMEVSQDVEHTLGQELQKAIDNEVANEIAKASLLSQGWYIVTVDSWSDIGSDWCDANIVGRYHCFGHYWYFERTEDATMFSLRWT